MSELLLLGTSHKTAPLAVRERIALPEGARSGSCASCWPHPEIREAVVLSTCNRTELYVVVRDPVEAETARARHARPPGRPPPDRADRGHLLAAQLRRRAPPLPRDERAGVDDRRRGRGPGPGQARLRGGARGAHDRPADQQAVPRRAGDRQARAHGDGDRRRRGERRLGRGRGRAQRAGRARQPPRADHRRGRDGGADGAGADRAGRLDDVRRQPAARPGDRARPALRRRDDRLRRAAGRARAGRHRGRLDRLAAPARRRGGARARHRGARRPAAAAARPRGAARHRSRLRGARRRDARRHRRPAGAGRAHALARGGSRRAAPRASSRRRSRRSPAGSGRSRCCRRSPRCASRPTRSSPSCSPRTRALGVALRARPRARRGDAARRGEAAAARADAALRALGEDRRTRACSSLRELFGLEDAAGAAEAQAPAPRCRAAAGRPVRLGTRGSALALAQARWVAERLPGAGRARRDHHRRRPARDVGDKSRWTGALEQALLAGEIDLAVHSAKDVPGELAPGTAIVAVPPREDPRDVLVGAPSLAALPEGARVGTSALRRRAQLLARAAGPRRGRAARQRRHAAAQAGRRARSTRSCWRPPGSPAGPRRRRRRRWRATVFVPRPARAASLVQARAGRGRFDASTTRRTRGALMAERGGRARSAPRATRRSASTPAATRDARVRRPARRLGVAGRRGLGAARRSAWPSGCSRRRGGPAGARRGDGDRPGTVYLVGAGPGDPGLLTVRAAELIARADVILYDRLIPAEALAGARPDAELVYVGKQGGGPQVPQEEIDRLLLEHARAGRTVVRLKGGDPFVFGRGGEEALVCREAGIPFEVVPGRHRGRRRAGLRGHPGHAPRPGLRRGVRHRPRGPGEAGDGARLAGARGVPGHARLLHGRARAAADRRAARGRRPPPDEPVAVVERGTLPGQRTLLATLADVAERAAARGSGRRRSRWSGRSPALRERARVARARARCTGARSRSRARGRRRARSRRGCASSAPTVVEAPAIRTQPLDAELPGPRRLRPRLRDLAERRPRAVRALDGAASTPARSPADVAAIGPGTARALGEHGIRADVVPARAVAEGLVEALAGVRSSARWSCAAREGRDVLPDALRARGAEVDVLALYETVAEPLDGDGAPPPRRPTTSRSPRPRPCASSSPPPARSPARGSPRSARRRAPRCASAGSSRTSRPTRTRPTAWSRRSWPTGRDEPVTLLTDYGTADEFVGAPHGRGIARVPAARVIDLTHGIRRHDVVHGR